MSTFDAASNEFTDAIGETLQGYILLLENFAPMADITAGYKNRCEQAGFSPPVSEYMAAQFHSGLVDYTFSQLKVQAAAENNN